MKKSIQKVLFLACLAGSTGIVHAKYSPNDTNIPAMTLSSEAFPDKGVIQEGYSAYDNNQSPSLRWSGAPLGTKSFAIICKDIDLNPYFFHWGIFNIPGQQKELSKGMTKIGDLPNGIKQCKNGTGTLGYFGPKPPAGKPHTYVFEIYALDVETLANLLAGSSAEQLINAMKGHVVAKGTLKGTYQKSS